MTPSTLLERRTAETTGRQETLASSVAPTLDVLFVAWNRLEFTRAALELLLANTDWTLVRRLVVIDDGSTDGTAEYLQDALAYVTGDWGVEVVFHRTEGLGPPAIMNLYVQTLAAGAATFAKIDNDIAVPPGWLPAMLDVHARSGVELLGMEAGRLGVPGRDEHPEPQEPAGYGWEACSHIGGVGLMALAAFTARHPIPGKRNRRFGFTEWQDRWDVPRAWIYPDLLVPQLDRVPLEPWRSLSREYVGRGWQREWPDYSPAWMRPYFDWLPGAEAALAAGQET